MRLVGHSDPRRLFLLLCFYTFSLSWSMRFNNAHPGPPALNNFFDVGLFL